NFDLGSTLYTVYMSVRWGVDAMSAHQFPLSLVHRSGSPMNITCSITDHSNPNMYWYRQGPEHELELLFYSIGTGDVDPIRLDRFRGSRHNSSHFTLESTALAVDDSAVYFCAGSAHS
uniref:Ig-like domain-containing protein n=1 Tax=Lepisosteus oculatus TaxID=7918 RepID=W5N788_LEPOC